jgi:FkbM family methyltransferase
MTKQAAARVSARMTNIDFDKKYGTKYCIPEWLRDEQIKIAIRKIKGRIETVNEKRSEPIAVVGFGPSLKDTWEQVKNFKYVMSCSGAHKFLIERGIVPTWHVEVDPRSHKIDLLGSAHKDVTYLPSSTSHPKYLDHLLASGADVKLWHVFTTEAEGNRILPSGEWALTGGADAGLRALVMARIFGFVDIHVFGIDGSAGKATQSHADKHPNSPGKFFDCEYPEGSGRIYKTTPALLSCAKSVPHEIKQLKDAKFTFYGEGLVQAIMRNEKTEPLAKETQIAFLKPDLISDEYRKLNARLHDDNPLYGTSGTKYVDTVLRLAKQMETTSILDYGCGKGLLAKGIPFPIWEYDPAVPGKDESPRPADVVVCTDVLEHIEPEHLSSVLSDIARCTTKVGFLVIHTGPAQKTLPDGRNAHLIQQPAKWWEKKLGKFFDVAKVLTVGQSVHVVVGPRTGNGDGIIRAQHDGTIAKFYAVNDTTKWRAQTLFTKEPSTIEWIDTFKPGEVLWDVGANVGGYSIWASRRRAVKVYAFEPDAQNYAVLCRNMALNQVDGLAYCIALGNPDRAEIGTIYLSGMEAGGSCNTYGEAIGPYLEPRTGIKQGAVCMSGDALDIPLPDHIKIDVDGLEHIVIAGMWNKVLSSKSLLVEVNEALPDHLAMIDKIKSAGFTFDKSQVESSKRKDGPFKGCAEYVFRRNAESNVMAYTLKRIAGAELRMNPFPHLYVEDVFQSDFYQELLKSLPVNGWKSLEDSRGTKGYPERSVNDAPDCVSWMLSGELRRLLDDKFGVQSKSDELLLLRDSQGYKIPPHTDTPSKVISALFYLPKDKSLEQYGTSVFKPKKAGFTCPNGKHYKFEDFEKVWTAPFRPNSAMIFARTDTSFHGVEPFDNNGVRDILLYDSKC